MAFRSRGLPSRGCNKCRERKTRCDEGKPTCQNCVKIGHTECKYRDEFERTWRFHTEKKAEKKTEKEAEEPVEPSSQLQKQADDAAIRRQLVIHRYEPRVDAAPQLSAKVDPVLARFFFDWASGLTPTPGVGITWFDTLQSMHENASSDSVLRKAINAVAHVNYGKRYDNIEFVDKGSVLYGETLHALADALRWNTDMPIRDVLASAVLLCIHEAFVNPLISPSGSWQTHVGGASILLEKQSELNMGIQSSEDLQLRSMIFRQMIHRSLVTGQKPVSSREQDVKLQDPRLAHVNKHGDLIYRAALLCSQWRLAFSDIDTPSGLFNLGDIARQAMTLDKELERWEQNLPASQRYTVEPVTATEETPDWLRHFLASPGAPRYSHSFQVPVAKVLWRFSWETRVILCQALLYTSYTLNSRGATLDNPIAGRELELEARLLQLVDRLSESCISAFTDALKESTSTLKIEDVRSLSGYLMLQLLPTVDLCLGQISLRSENVDLESRRAWIASMKGFVRLRLGFSKAAGEVDVSQFVGLPVQLWSLTKSDHGYSDN